MCFRAPVGPLLLEDQEVLVFGSLRALSFVPGAPGGPRQPKDFKVPVFGKARACQFVPGAPP